MFRRLRRIECTHPVNALHMIEAAFVMHNFILYHERGGDDDDDDIDMDGSDVPEMSLNLEMQQCVKLHEKSETVWLQHCELLLQ